MLERGVFRQEPHHVYLCQELNLARWIESPRDRASKYFEAIDTFRELILRNFEVAPQDEDIVLVLEGVLSNDGTFDEYLNQRRGDPQLADPDFRRNVKRAAAGMILERYNEARIVEELPS